MPILTIVSTWMDFSLDGFVGKQHDFIVLWMTIEGLCCIVIQLTKVLGELNEKLGIQFLIWKYENYMLCPSILNHF